ncbi:hypothetical protein GX50_00096 [[Emmonsia] crescens]|uniref:Aminoglycoside phosphotransferase domain-containing protein n=1 Tax=[Emmonsia] crescens TaxID=73230 RepID=A0A2B7ZV98_9EURO|nr:hypothetical protein GX50_00096 [Emmonsia crescens]
MILSFSLPCLRSQTLISIIQYCRSRLEDQLLGGSWYGNRVVKLPDCDQVVKFGNWVLSHEAENQRRAYERVDANFVTVPRVHEFFQDDGGWGYIVMDFIQGEIINTLSDYHFQRLANVLEHFSSITDSAPGSLGGGSSMGLLWPDTNDLTIKSIKEVEEWFNSRLFPGQGEVRFKPSPFVLCHLDIAPRNIIWLHSERICLLDWASAGFYPRLLEFASQHYQEDHFSAKLLNTMGHISEYDAEQQRRIFTALYNTERYSFRQRDTEEEALYNTASHITLPSPPQPSPPPPRRRRPKAHKPCRRRWDFGCHTAFLYF